MTDDTSTPSVVAQWNKLAAPIKALLIGGTAFGLLLFSCCGGCLSLAFLRSTVQNDPTLDASFSSREELHAVRNPRHTDYSRKDAGTTGVGHEWLPWITEKNGMRNGPLYVDGKIEKFIIVHPNGRKAAEYFGERPYPADGTEHDRFWDEKGEEMERIAFLDKFEPKWREMRDELNSDRFYGRPRQDENGKWVSGREAYRREVEAMKETLDEHRRKGSR